MRSQVSAAIATLAAAQYVPECNTDEYIAMSASDKMDLLWSKITADSSEGTW